MKILKYILYGILAIIVLFLLIALAAPKHIKVERSVTINAPKDVVFNNVRTLRAMHEWSPWADYDPNMKLEYSGNDGEVGSTYAWQGNDQVGKGKQTITSVSNNRVEMNLEFLEPWESKAVTFVEVNEEGGASKATWGFETRTPFPWNAMNVFMDMDAMLGKDFEKGLEKLKVMSESNKSGASSAYEIHEMDMESKTYVAKRAIVGFQDFEKFYSTNYPAIMESLGKSKIEPAGAPSAVFYKWDEKEMKADVAAGIPVSNNKAKITGYETIGVAGGKALHIAYYGAYEKSGNAHMAMDKYMKDKGITNREVIEEYVTDPASETDTTKWLTNIYYMVK